MFIFFTNDTLYHLRFDKRQLAPRYAFGYWYSRYWAYSDRDFENIVDGFDRSATPIDVMVVDMDWHLDGWTGYTWDKRYFPDPDRFLKHMHRKGLRVTLNLHPADGVGKHEELFSAMCKSLGADPEKTERIPFDVTDEKFIKSYFEILHHPEEKRGVDFWWMDWQQGKEIANLNNTMISRWSKCEERLGQKPGSTARRISLAPETFYSEVADMRSELPALIEMLDVLVPTVIKDRNDELKSANIKRAKLLVDEIFV